MLVEIKHRYTGEVLFPCDVPADVNSSMAMRHALEKATQSAADLLDADLRGADLLGAYLRGADLLGAYLRGANLSGADLSSANLRGADLSGAYLSSANLRGADLLGAYLRGANLRGADMSGAYLLGANLSGADLSGANLSGADLSGAYLRGADLSGAYLRGAKRSDLVIAKTRILPAGDLIGWKKCEKSVIVKLRIPADAKRSHSFGRKCRAEYVEVLEVFGAEFGVTSDCGPRTEYRVGQIVRPDSFDENWQNECSNGIHFFITREEAEDY